jgi:hypothetical protein
VNRITRFQRIMLWCFALSFVLSQALGVAHRAVHLDLRIIGHEHGAAKHDHSHDHAHGDACASHGWLASLFAGHEEGDESCRLMDVSFKSDALNSTIAGVFIALGALFLIAFSQAQIAALRAAQAQARAPPL